MGTKHYIPGRLKDLRPGDPDWSALEFIDVSRLARTGQVERRMGWTRERTQERLRDFYDAGWVTKFPEHTGNKGGSKQDVWGLTSKGALKLKGAKGFRLGPANLNKRNAEMLDEYGYIKGNFKHTIGIAEVAARFHAGARATGGRVEFIDQPDVFRVLPETTQEKSRPFGWQVTIPRAFPDPDDDAGYDAWDEHREGVVPDRVMGLDLRYKTKRTWFFLEYYKNMKLFKNDLVNQRSVMRKLLSLVRTRERQQTEYFLTNHFGFAAFRGMIILHPDEPYKEEINVDNLLRYIDTYLEPEEHFRANMFLMANWWDLHPDNILYTPFRNARGETVHLIE